MTRTIGSIDLRQNIRARLEEVRNGARLTVTRSGVPVAQLVPIPATDDGDHPRCVVSDHPRTWEWQASGEQAELRAPSGDVYGRVIGCDWSVRDHDDDWTEPLEMASHANARAAAYCAATISWHERNGSPGFRRRDAACDQQNVPGALSTLEVCGVPIRFRVQLNPEGDRIDLCAWGPDEDVGADEPWIVASVDRETGLSDDAGTDGVYLAVRLYRKGQDAKKGAP